MHFSDDGVSGAVGIGQFLHGILVGRLCAIEAIAEAAEVFDEAYELVVEQAALVGNFLDGVFLLFLFPDKINGAHGGQQRGGRHHDDIFFEGLQEQFIVVLECGVEGRFEGDKHKYVVRGMNLVERGVVFTAQITDMPADAFGMLLEVALLFGGIVGGEEAFEGDERHFGVNDQIFAFRQMDNEVWPFLFAFIVGVGGLSEVVSIFLEAYALEEGFELKFAPIALHFVVTFEGAGQVIGILAELQVEFAQQFDFFFEADAVAGFFHEFLVDLVFEYRDAFLEGL